MTIRRPRSLRVLLFLWLCCIALPTFAQQTEIHFLTAGYPVVLNTLMREVLIPEFEAETGYKVIMEAVGWPERMERILLLHAAGIPPDVVSTGYYSHYEEAASGLLMPLTEYMAEWEMRDLIPAAIWHSLEWQGEVHVIPQWFDIRGMAYNQNTFADSGFDPDTSPQSWEQLVNYARRLTRLDESGRVIRRGFIHHYDATQNLMWYMIQAGTEPVHRETLTSQLDSRAALDSLNVMLELQRAGELNLSGPAVSGLATGAVGITYANPQNVNSWETAYPGAMEHIVVYPARRSPDSPPIAANFINGLAIPAASEKKDAAWQWIAYLYRDDVQRQIHAATGWVSPRVDLVVDLIDRPGLGYFYELIGYTWAPLLPPPRRISQPELTALITQVLQEAIPPEQALLQGHELWSRLLREWEF